MHVHERFGVFFCIGIAGAGVLLFKHIILLFKWLEFDERNQQTYVAIAAANAVIIVVGDTDDGDERKTNNTT